MYRSLNILLSAAVLFLVGMGLVILASTSAWARGHADPYYYFNRQLSMAVIGVFFAVFLAFLDPHKLRRIWPWLLAVTCVLLALCFVPGVAETINGERRWVKAPIIGRFQPSEIAKGVTMLALAGWYARWQTEVSTFWRGFVIPGFLLGLPVLLILLETDMGTAASLGIAGFAVFFVVGVKLWYIFPSIIIGLAALYKIVKSNANRWSRIEAWLNLDDRYHQLNKGLQQARALEAFERGGKYGQGLGSGYEKLKMPFAHTDFIFPNIGEELGLFGTLPVIGCYVIITITGIGIANYATNTFNRCLAIGLTASIVIPAIVNIAVTTATLPNTGLPLPFISYGGTNLIFTLGTVGLLLGIHRQSCLKHPKRRSYLLARKPVEMHL